MPNLKVIKSLLPSRNDDFIVAASGGVDSMVLLDFLVRGGRKPIVCYFNHGTAYGDMVENGINSTCEQHGLEFLRGDIRDYPEKAKGESKESFWRDCRYLWLESIAGEVNASSILLGHHLNDAMENWIMTSLHGKPAIIPEKRLLASGVEIRRPLILNEKKAFYEWADNHHVWYEEDESNQDVRFTRNRVRHNIMPEVLTANPGFAKVILKKYLYKD